MINRCLAAIFAFTLPALSADPTWAIGDAPLRASFRAGEPPAAPEAGWAISFPELGQTTPNLADLVLTDEKGTQIPIAKVFRNEGDRVLILAQNLAKGQLVYLYYGGNQQRRDLKWEPRTSLLLETRRLPEGAKMDDWGQLEDAWKTAGEVEGAGFVPSISHTENPFGASNNFVSHYSGYLRHPDKKATLYTISSDASFILADGRPVFGWPGKHGAQSTEMTAPRGEVNVNDGLVKIDYYHAKEGTVPVMVLGWIRDGKFQAIPADAWLHPGETETTGIEHSAGWPVPNPKTQVATRLIIGSQWLFETVASLPAPLPEGWKARWEWSDGGTVDGPESRRILAGPYPVSVKLRLLNGSQEIAGSRRIVFAGEMRSNESTGDAENYLKLIQAEDPARLTPATLTAYMALLIERGVDDVLGRYGAAWLAKNNNQDDPLWIASQMARIRSVAQTNAPSALTELRKFDAATRKKFPQLRMLELEILIWGQKNPDAQHVAQKLALDLPDTNFARLAKIRQGDLHRLMGRAKEARETYESVPKPLPDDPDGSKLAELNRSFFVASEGFITKNQRRLAEEKLAEWELTHPMAKYDSDYLLLRGRLLLMFGRWNEALLELESFRAIRVENPLQVMADFYRARALAGLGRADDAKKIWAELVTKYPDHELAPEAARLAQ